MTGNTGDAADAAVVVGVRRNSTLDIAANGGSAFLTVANDALFGLIGSSLVVASIVTILGVVLFFLGKKSGKKLPLILGIIAGILGILAVITNLGASFPFLTVGIPAIPSLYFDWFGGCIQAFIFCTLTTLFIKQAAGD